MSYRTGIIASLLAGSFFTLINVGIINTACANQGDAAEILQPAAKSIHGRVTDVIEAAGYTYAEVDTGKEKVRAATSLRAGAES